MIRKILPLVFLMVSFFNGTAQTLPCAENYIITNKTIESPNSQINHSNITWDFSKTTNKDTLILKLEIQPLNACWEGLDGTKRSEKIVHNVDNLAKKSIGNFVLKFNDINAKCYKWRVKIINRDTNCKSDTAWQFYSFL